jgi:hypothetical protein
MEFAPTRFDHHLLCVSTPTCNDLAFNFNFFLTKERKLGSIHYGTTSIARDLSPREAALKAECRGHSKNRFGGLVERSDFTCQVFYM